MSLLGLVVVVGGWSYRLLPGLLAPDNSAEQTSAAPAEPGEGPAAAAPAPSATDLSDDEKNQGPARLTITVEPPGATVVLDGEELDELPFLSTGTIERGKHYVVASAPGYETAWRRFRLDDDLELEIELEKLPSWTAEELTDADDRDDDDRDDDRDDDENSDSESDDDKRDSRKEVAKKKRDRDSRKSRDRERARKAAKRRRDDRSDRDRDRRAARRSREESRRPERTPSRRDEEREREERREQAAAEREERKPQRNDDARSDDGGRMRPGQSLRRVRKKSRTIDKENPFK